MKINEIIKKEMEKQNIAIETLVSKLNFSKETLLDIESGRVIPSDELIKEIYNALNVKSDRTSTNLSNDEVIDEVKFKKNCWNQKQGSIIGSFFISLSLLFALLSLFAWLMYHIELADKAANYSYMALFSLVFLFVGGAIDVYAMSKFNFFIRDEEIGEGIIITIKNYILFMV